MTKRADTHLESPPSRRASRLGWIALLVLVNLAYFAWWFSGVFMRAFRGCESFVGADKVACESANGGTPAATVIAVWVVTDFVLIAIWLAMGRRARTSDLPTRPDA